MKHILNALIISALVVTTNQSVAQNEKKIETIEVEVSGVCGMCKERIENAALIKGVKKVEWSLDTQILNLVYRADKVTKEDILKSVAAVGHDSEVIKATDEEYGKIHHCCRYRGLESH